LLNCSMETLQSSRLERLRHYLVWRLGIEIIRPDVAMVSGHVVGSGECLELGLGLDYFRIGRATGRAPVLAVSAIGMALE
jgi:hypothetical protein